jgi:hypothetical protein
VAFASNGLDTAGGIGKEATFAVRGFEIRRDSLANNRKAASTSKREDAATILSRRPALPTRSILLLPDPSNPDNSRPFPITRFPPNVFVNPLFIYWRE